MLESKLSTHTNKLSSAQASLEKIKIFQAQLCCFSSFAGNLLFNRYSLAERTPLLFDGLFHVDSCSKKLPCRELLVHEKSLKHRYFHADRSSLSLRMNFIRNYFLISSGLKSTATRNLFICPIALRMKFSQWNVLEINIFITQTDLEASQKSPTPTALLSKVTNTVHSGKSPFTIRRHK